jgi:hypothetical protein
MQEGRVVPFLLDVEFKDISGPLAQFQAKKVEKAGVCDVIHTINKLSEGAVPDDRLKSLLELLWPNLEEKIQKIPKAPSPVKATRPQAEVLEELVSSIRGLEMRVREGGDDFPRYKRRKMRMHPGLIDDLLHVSKIRKGDPLRYVIMSSFMREDFPWIYELGLEAYRASQSGNRKNAELARERFIECLRMLRRGPFLEMGFSDKESHMYLRDLEHLLMREIETGNLVMNEDDMIDEIGNQSKPKEL